MPHIKISAIIVTYNEEANIERCLASLVPVADEIIVLDSFSTDKTEAICRKYNVHFMHRAWAGYSESKNFVNQQAQYDYLLSIDADEALSPALSEAILSVKDDPEYDGYYVNRKTNYCGQWIKHGGWYPDRKLRLWRRGKGKWVGRIHEKIIMLPDARIGSLSGDLLHYSFNSIAEHIRTANNFSTIAAEDAVKNGHKTVFFIHIILNPVFTFFRKFLLQFGFLDGYHGFVISTISAFANFLKYTKIRELTKNAS